jgi:hypothetical protein
MKFEETIKLDECITAIKELKMGKAVGEDTVANELK